MESVQMCRSFMDMTKLKQFDNFHKLLLYNLRVMWMINSNTAYRIQVPKHWATNPKIAFLMLYS
jgi:hypothetical protein